MSAVLTALFLATAPAQASPAPGPAKRVELFVVVTEDGRRLTDLVAEDFEVFETGQRQRLTHFEAVFGPANAEARGRRLLFVVDDDHMTPGELGPVKGALHQIFESRLGPGDEAAVVLVSAGPEPGDAPGESTPGDTCQISLPGPGGPPTAKSVPCRAPEFTSDRKALGQSVDRLQVPEPPRPSRGYPSLLTEYQAMLIRGDDAEALALAVDENKATEPPTRPEEDYPSTLYPLVREKARTIADSRDRTTAFTLASLERHVRSLRYLPGRKVLVVFSGGFFGGAVAGTIFDSRLQPIADAAVRSGVVVHVVNARRPAASPTLAAGAAEPAARSRIEEKAMESAREGQARLAGWTGGLAFPGGDDMGKAFDRILGDSGNYYRLEYERRPAADWEFFRRIVVRVPTRFTGPRIRAATGYTVRLGMHSPPLE